VPIDAILFGGRRATNVPLVAEAYSWEHGVFLGATVSSEKTAAAEGTVGELRRDPFAMLPFCGYNMADYWGHWLSVGRATTADKLPRIYQVNWFRKGADGHYLWPGFGDNSRVLDWVVRRVSGHAQAVDSPIGRMPAPGELHLEGLNLPAEDVEALFEIHPDSWLAEADLTEEYFAQFGDRVPAELQAQLDQLRARLTDA
jgi:phosphoenolpyruvate carboxykinase (GTP)